jgi:NAD(P)-dependent dehydrogenase (short-subunit alcohol dehydrogenase family)
MVSYKQIQASNALISDATIPSVSVFVGGTAGIGKYTIEALVRTGQASKIYLIGRKSSHVRSEVFIRNMRAINPKAEIIWTEGEISLLAEAKRICDIIKSKESRVDLLFLTAGYAPFGPREETSEGIDIAQSLRYYSRMVFIVYLLPLLNRSEASRVVSVLMGGFESAGIDLDDLGLDKPGNFGPIQSHKQVGAMNTLFMEQLAVENPAITFIHSHPGLVNTGNARRGFELVPNSVTSWFFWLVVEPIIALVGTSHEKSGQLYLFQSTSAAFGGRGITWDGKAGLNTLGKPANGLFLVNSWCDTTLNANVLRILREKGAREKVWEHTQQLLRSFCV